MTKRRYTRLTLARSIRADVGLVNEGRIVDVGLGGARVEHRAVLRPGEPCVLRFPLSDRVFAFRSRVVWSRALDRRAGRPRGDLVFHSGLAFETIPDGAKPLLGKLLGESMPGRRDHTPSL